MEDSAGTGEVAVSWLIGMLICLKLARARLGIVSIEYNVRICKDGKKRKA